MHNLESQTFSRNSAHSCFRRSSCWNTMALFLKMSATATASLSPNSFPVLLTILENCWRSWNVTGCMYCWMSLQGGDGQSKNSRIWSKVASFGSEAVIQCGLLSLCMASQASVKVAISSGQTMHRTYDVPSRDAWKERIWSSILWIRNLCVCRVAKQRRHNEDKLSEASFTSSNWRLLLIIPHTRKVTNKQVGVISLLAWISSSSARVSGSRGFADGPNLVGKIGGSDSTPQICLYKTVTCFKCCWYFSMRFLSSRVRKTSFRASFTVHCVSSPSSRQNLQEMVRLLMHTWPWVVHTGKSKPLTQIRKINAQQSGYNSFCRSKIVLANRSLFRDILYRLNFRFSSIVGFKPPQPPRKKEYRTWENHRVHVGAP